MKACSGNCGPPWYGGVFEILTHFNSGEVVHLALRELNRPDYSLSRKQRLRAPGIIRETFERGRRYAGRLMVMVIREAGDVSLRLGVVAGRKAVGGAVERNRAKRRLREAFRLNRHRLECECDVILVARGKLLEAPWQEVQKELVDLADKAGILAKKSSGD